MQACVTLTVSVTKLAKLRIKRFCDVHVWQYRQKVSKNIAILLVSRYIEVSSVSPSTNACPTHRRQNSPIYSK